MDQQLLTKAKFCSIVERFYDDSDFRKLGDVGLAFIDCIDYALENRLIHNGDELPEELAGILKNVIIYLGDQT